MLRVWTFICLFFTIPSYGQPLLCESWLSAMGSIETVGSLRIQRISRDLPMLNYFISPRIRVMEPGQPDIVYTHTKRSLWLLKADRFYPEDMLDAEQLKGLNVVDLGTGKGVFIEDLRKAGVNAVGIDIYLTRQNKKKAYFIQADMRNTGLPSASQDIAYATYTVVSYEANDLSPNYERVRQVFSEAHRILRAGGLFRISPIMNIEVVEVKNGIEFRNFRELAVLKISGWRIRRSPDHSWFQKAGINGDCYKWVELQKI